MGSSPLAIKDRRAIGKCAVYSKQFVALRTLPEMIKRGSIALTG